MLHNCVTTHGIKHIMFANFQEAKQIFQYKNLIAKLYKTNSEIKYNKTRRQKQLTPNYVPIIKRHSFRKYVVVGYGPGSSVGIATELRAGRYGIEFRL